MNELASGRLDVEVPGIGRGDEVGDQLALVDALAADDDGGAGAGGALAVAAFSLSMVPLQGQQAPAYRAPRLADGHPDLNGIWQTMNTANYDIQTHMARPALQVRPGPYGPVPAPSVLALGAVASVPPGMGVVEGDELPYLPAALEQKIALQKAGKAETNVTVGGEPPDGELRKSLDKKTGEIWAGYSETGATSAAMAQDMQVLDELIKVAPQGPIGGRLAEMFPGVSSAGDAFQSVVKRVAPTLRAPGSGATSDIEYDGMLRSLPALRNQPEANAMIAEIMKSKASINIERARIVDAYGSGTMSAGDARKAIAELDKRSIMTPEMKKALEGLGGGDAAPAGGPAIGAVQDGYRFKGGDPADPNSWEPVN